MGKSKNKDNKKKKNKDDEEQEETQKHSEYGDVMQMLNMKPAKSGKSQRKKDERKVKSKDIPEFSDEEEEPKPKPSKNPKKLGETPKEEKEVDIPKPKLKLKKKKKEESSDDEAVCSEYKEEDEKEPKQRSKVSYVEEDEVHINDEDIQEIEKQFATPKKKKPAKGKTTQKKTVKKTSRKSQKKPAKNEIVGPLNGETIVITGLLDVDREDLENLLKGLGAKVTKSVSGSTTILIHGTQLEDGRDFTEGNKYKQAVAKGTENIFSQSEFEDWMKVKLNDNNWSVTSAVDAMNNNNSSLTMTALHDEEITKGTTIPKMPEGFADRNLLWTDKYAPTAMDDIIGNGGVIKKFTEWLDHWDDAILRGNKRKSTPKWNRGGGGGKPTFENLNARACLISGDPGIGKTSSVRLIAKLKGYNVLEENASDRRNKALIKKGAGFAFDNCSLETGKNTFKTKNLIIMDEVDGMAGNQDRGGISALIEIIKKTQIPIVCICNDRQCQKLKSLANHCYDLKYAKPDKREIAKRLMKICEKEKVQCEQNALEFLVESVGNDIRQCLNFLELWSRNVKTLTYTGLKSNYNSFNKDYLASYGAFSATKEILKFDAKRKYTIDELNNLYFVDYDLIPLLIYENYINCYTTGGRGTQEQKDLNNLRNFCEEADLQSMADVVDKRIHSNMEWTLLPDRGTLSTASAAFFTNGNLAWPKFPALFGKMSTLKKVKREAKELKRCFRGADALTTRYELSPIMLFMITNALDEDGSADSAIEIMKKYRLTLDMFKENILDLCDDKFKESFNAMSSSVKGNLTKNYNKNCKSSVYEKRKAKREKGEAYGVGKFDENGNVFHEKLDDATLMDEEEEDEESSMTKKSGKSKGGRKKSNASNNQGGKKKGKGKGKAATKGTTKGNKTKKNTQKGKKGKKTKKSEDSFIDDDEY
ncbi:MAG: AAA family ATPase [archaeon]|nr:AAA family ATPase [archaeon]